MFQRGAFLVLACTCLLAQDSSRAGKSFSQETPQSSEQQAEAVVVGLYKQVVLRKPIGIPQKAARRAIWPLLSRSLIECINTAQACERDWDRQYPNPNLKPTFGWLEFGLFSGGNEQADPSRFSVRGTVKQKDGSYIVRVKLTYWSEFEKYHQPRGAKYDWNWEVVVFVIRDGNHYAVNDVLYSAVDPKHAELRLSQLLSRGCDHGKWVVYSE